MQNLGSKGSVGVKYKDDICDKLCLNFGLKTTGVFCNIESGWF